MVIFMLLSSAQRQEREKIGGWRAERGAKLFNNFIVAGRIITILPSTIPRNKTDKEESSVNHFSDLQLGLSQCRYVDI